MAEKKTESKAEASAESKKSVYRVRGTDIKHGDPVEHYPEGSDIELTDVEAEKLKRWLAPTSGKSKAAESEGDQK